MSPKHAPALNQPVAAAGPSISEEEQGVFASHPAADQLAKRPCFEEVKMEVEPTKQSVLALHHARSQAHSVCLLLLLGLIEVGKKDPQGTVKSVHKLLLPCSRRLDYQCASWNWSWIRVVRALWKPC